MKVVNNLDKISIVGIFTASFPETLLFIILGLLAIGKFNFLKEKSNLVRIIISSLIATIAFYYIRPSVNNVIENLIVSFFLYELLFLFIVRLRFYESILSSIFTISMIVLIEALYLGPLLAISGLSIEQMYASDLKRFLFSLPERVIQIILIFLSIKYRIKIVDLESTGVNKRGHYAQLIVNILSAGTLAFLVAVITKALLFDHGNFNNSTTLLLLRINVYLTLFVTVSLLMAIKSLDEFHRNKRDLNNKELVQSLEYVSKLMDNKDFAEAKESIENLKNHISSCN